MRLYIFSSSLRIALRRSKLVIISGLFPLPLAHFLLSFSKTHKVLHKSPVILHRTASGLPVSPIYYLAWGAGSMYLHDRLHAVGVLITLFYIAWSV